MSSTTPSWWRRQPTPGSSRPYRELGSSAVRRPNSSVGESRTVGVVLMDVANPFFAEMVRGAEHVLRDEGYVLMVCSSDASSERERRYLRLLRGTPSRRLADRACRDCLGPNVTVLARRGIPTVLLDRDTESTGLCSVTVDDVRGGELAASHLFALGHDVIGFVDGHRRDPPVPQTEHVGARLALRQASRSGDKQLREVVAGALSVPSTVKTLWKDFFRLSRGPPPSCAPTTSLPLAY